MPDVSLQPLERAAFFMEEIRISVWLDPKEVADRVISTLKNRPQEEAMTSLRKRTRANERAARKARDELLAQAKDDPTLKPNALANAKRFARSSKN